MAWSKSLENSIEQLVADNFNSYYKDSKQNPCKDFYNDSMFYGVEYIESNAKNYQYGNIVKIGNLVSTDREKLQHFVNQSDDFYLSTNLEIESPNYKTSILKIHREEFRKPFKKTKRKLELLYSPKKSYRSSEQNTDKSLLLKTHVYNLIFFPEKNYIKVSRSAKRSDTVLFNKETNKIYRLSKNKVKFASGNINVTPESYEYLHNRLFKTSGIMQHQDLKIIKSKNLKCMLNLDFLHKKFNKKISKDLQCVVDEKVSDIRAIVKHVYKDDTKKASKLYFGTSNKKLVSIFKDILNNNNRGVSLYQPLFSNIRVLLLKTKVDHNQLVTLCSTSFPSNTLYYLLFFLYLNTQFTFSVTKFINTYKTLEIVLDDFRIVKQIYRTKNESLKPLLETFYKECSQRSYLMITRESLNFPSLGFSNNNMTNFHGPHYGILNFINKEERDERDKEYFNNYESLSTKFDRLTDDLNITVAKNPLELKEIGNNLNICVGSYSDSVHNGNCNILILRNKDKQDLCCIEVKGDKIVQAKLKRNNRLSSNSILQQFVLDYSKKVNLKIDTRDIENELSKNINYAT